MRLLVISLLVFLPISIYAESPASVDRTYFWEFEGKRYRLTYSFEKQAYNHYKSIPREYYDFAKYLNEDPGFVVAREMANKLEQLAEHYHFDEKEKVEFIASFVQHLKYESDGKYEYPRYPIETLVDQKGDCEDSAILLASLLQAIGYKVVLLSPVGHMGVGLAIDGKLDGVGVNHEDYNYYYIETTNKGWGIGDYPDHLSSEIQVFDSGSRLGTKPLAINNSKTDKNESYAEQISTKEEVISGSGMQTEYHLNKRLIGADDGSLSKDKMIIDGKEQTAVTYKSGQSVKIVASNY